MSHKISVGRLIRGMAMLWMGLYSVECRGYGDGSRGGWLSQCLLGGTLSTVDPV